MLSNSLNWSCLWLSNSIFSIEQSRINSSVDFIQIVICWFMVFINSSLLLLWSTWKRWWHDLWRFRWWSILIKILINWCLLYWTSCIIIIRAARCQKIIRIVINMLYVRKGCIRLDRLDILNEIIALLILSIRNVIWCRISTSIQSSCSSHGVINWDALLRLNHSSACELTVCRLVVFLISILRHNCRLILVLELWSKISRNLVRLCWLLQLLENHWGIYNLWLLDLLWRKELLLLLARINILWLSV